MSAATPALDRAALLRWVAARRQAGQRIVLTNGVFDLLHLGHVRYLQQARALGDALVVALNSDASTRLLKGPQRPITPEAERAEVLAALACVDAVTIFGERTAETLVAALRPEIYAKGGDYASADAAGMPQRYEPAALAALPAGDALFARLPEARVVAEYGGTLCLIPYVPGHSTSALIARIRGAATRA
ncbi:MAG TPA: adenylyltransferase/cytidyltransferase family protein [Ktedonobacterales bacterium]|nr:adenylyltransferase/cytidyltransferase family protein [Ktedonobacterales bacterium]